ncbi:glucuronate isomerase [Perlabentimonas gracilis]|uniref:glucuronate isomerase n=1 Tax=Perlabentimonas gracilis TaxID=2715279 RepID=UPI00140CBB3F|nr:glucuronate isomerase [Perlabentimonas gracilis]NHB68649.1 glucuronate isomerase [Perlabentimonas gracilis]
MKAFMDENFLLQNKTAEELYHQYAKDMPIIDYHCHLPPQEIGNDHQFSNMTKIWLDGDHYKWRAMRALGVDEKYCTGDASDYEKFEKWAYTVPYTLRNPLYHWTLMELRRPFGVTKLLNPSTAREIYDQTTAMLNTPAFSARGIMRRMNVELVCTTDDPIDNLEHHIKTRNDGFEVKVLPTWRPDKAMMVEDTETFNLYLEKIEEVANINIRNFDDFVSALKARHDFFHEQGCRLSDHGIETIIAEDYTDYEIKEIFARVRMKIDLSVEEVLKFKSAMLYHFAIMDHSKGWVQQFHLGALRNNSSRMFKKLGADKGFDSIGDFEMAKPLSRFLDRLDSTNQLAKTILYNLNPRDNELLATMAGNFNDGSVAGKIQFGSGWWFLDQKDGMQKQMNALSSLGLLSQFVGMLTDSRSFLSYPRHDYFRRILCNLLGTDIENGEIPNDMELVGGMVKDICYNNAKKYFGF